MISIAQDISALTGIPKLTLEKLADKAAICISDSVLEALNNKEPQTEIDIGIGNLYIKLESNAVKYKFIPNKHLDQLICQTLITRESPIINQLDKALKERIEATYKELL